MSPSPFLFIRGAHLSGPKRLAVYGGGQRVTTSGPAATGYLDSAINKTLSGKLDVKKKGISPGWWPVYVSPSIGGRDGENWPVTSSFGKQSLMTRIWGDFIKANANNADLDVLCGGKSIVSYVFRNIFPIIGFLFSRIDIGFLEENVNMYIKKSPLLLCK